VKSIPFWRVSEIERKIEANELQTIQFIWKRSLQWQSITWTVHGIVKGVINEIRHHMRPAVVTAMSNHSDWSEKEFLSLTRNILEYMPIT